MAGWKSSWNSLAMRLILSFTLYVVATTAFYTIYPYTFVRDTLEDGLARRGEAEIKMMQGSVSGYLLLGMTNSIQSDIVGIPKDLTEVSYVAVADPNGVFLAHSDPTQVEKPWSGKGGIPPGAWGAVRRGTTYQGERILEVAAPVLVDKKPAGTMIIGLNYREVDNVLSRLLMRLGGVGLFVLVVSLLSTRPFTTHVVSGLTRLGKMTREVARGELRERIPEEGFEEIRALARDFNAMAGNLRTVLARIQETGASVGTFSSDFLTVIQDQAASASQQATSVAEVTATMEELSRTSRQIAQNAESVKEAASKSVEVAKAGTTLGREGVEAMAQIKERVGDIARKTLFLGEKSHEIGKVMEIIKEIASEIHLLALNAAIESAAAGEHGRRFAVVASEVRRLAEKTRESTETIRGIITEIQSATNSSVEATEQGTREVERWKETIRLSSEAFSEIIETIERTSEASTQISLATHQQTSANEQVVQAMRQIEEMVRVTASQMKESSTSASRLREMAGTLQEKTAVFHV
ncbi:MAG: methyl-accepting chemotaxis protein [Desulfobacteria bacterium]